MTIRVSPDERIQSLFVYESANFRFVCLSLVQVVHTYCVTFDLSRCRFFLHFMNDVCRRLITCNRHNSQSKARGLWRTISLLFYWTVPTYFTYFTVNAPADTIHWRLTTCDLSATWIKWLDYWLHSRWLIRNNCLLVLVSVQIWPDKRVCHVKVVHVFFLPEGGNNDNHNYWDGLFALTENYWATKKMS